MSYFTAEMHQIRFRLGLRPRTRSGSLQRSPDLLAAFQGATSKGRGRGEEGRGRERREDKGRQGKGPEGRGDGKGEGSVKGEGEGR